MNRIESLFQSLRAGKKKALMPFLTAGDPDLETTADLIAEVIRRGAHLVEVGIPYSDPVADGPVISASYTRALQKGVKLSDIFAMIRGIRSKGIDAPLVTMVSYAIVHRWGSEKYVAEAKEAGIDGLIVPDLPIEEAAGLLELATKHGLSLIQLVTPRTPRERASKIVRGTTGFLYYVSVAGITGERRELPPDLADHVNWLKSQTDLPIAIGFGISGPDQVRQLSPIADGVIVGSAIVRRIAEGQDRSRDELVRAIGEFVQELADAV
ncbi:MAG: tryptophan synthase subunit alpha [Isosphaeraceae bacterium]